MANHNYKLVEDPNGYTFNLKINTLTEKLSTPVSGSDLKFTYANRTDNSREEANLFSSFRLPIVDLIYFNSQFSNSAPIYLNQDAIISVEIPKDEYGELIDGKTLKFVYPYSGGTTTLYGTYSSLKMPVLDNSYSDPDPSLGNNIFPIGARQADLVSQQVVNPPPNSGESYKSNICLLFSDDIATPISGTSWATGWSDQAPFSVGGKEPYIYSDNFTYDQPVGIALLDSGFIVITDPTLVNGFLTTGAVNSDGTPYVGGTTDFADIYYSAGTAHAFYNSINTEYLLNVLCVAGANEFTESENPTFLNGISTTRVSELALYGPSSADPNKPGELLAYGKLDRPVQKAVGQVISFVVQIKA
jgi:hypothetical protein